MKFIKQFTDFLNEAYLKGGRQPLYHHTYRLKDIFASDTLKTSTPSYSKKGEKYSKSISLTRVNYIRLNGCSFNIRLVLDIDALNRDGYITEPFDEIGYNKKHTKDIPIFKSHGVQKRSSKTITVHKVAGLPQFDDSGIQPEYEERCYKDITNLGKYIIAVEFSTIDVFTNHKEHILEYLEKYPHIELKIVGKEGWERPKPINLDKYRPKPIETTDRETIKDIINNLS
jgi:hypothetical protein